MKKNTKTPTIAQVVTVYTMTDGTLRVCELHDTDLNSFGSERPIYCETPEDALEYLRSTDALSVNPAWYEDTSGDE